VSAPIDGAGHVRAGRDRFIQQSGAVRPRGDEASFGRYQVDEGAQTVTHRYEGANVRTLVGQDLPRRYQFTDGRLIIRPIGFDPPS
jgi:hypothetical protein